MKKLIVLLFLIANFTNADIIIGFDTESLNKETKKPTQKQLISINKIKKIAKKHNIKVKFKSLPWKRSLLMLEKGKLDGVINASFKTNRAKYAQYPMKDGIVDDSKRLNDGNSYYIYRHKDSHLRWDGKKFLNTGIVAAMENYAVVEDLEKHSNITIEKFRNNSEIVRQLSNNKFDAYAGSAVVTDRILKKFPALAKNIIRDSLPIRKKPYFLIFSKITYKAKSKEMELLWNGFAKLNKQQ